MSATVSSVSRAAGELWAPGPPLSTVPQFLVTNVTNANPAVLTLLTQYTPTPGWGTIIEGVAGAVGVNGVWPTITPVGGTQFSVPVAAGGAYTAGTGWVQSAAPATKFTYSIALSFSWPGTPPPTTGQVAIPAVPATGGACIATVAQVQNPGATVMNSLTSASYAFDTTLAPQNRWQAAQSLALSDLLAQLIALLPAGQPIGG
jgi:hypothetical protein